MNKAILVPLALAISAWAPWAITPLLMVGGAYLCLEGAEKLAHRLLHKPEDDAAAHEALAQALADPNVSLADVERDKIKGAVRTDFVLSAEIIAITLGTVTAQPLPSQFTVLASVAVLMTVGVYGLVAGIVKLDDLGLWLTRRPGDGAVQAIGRALVLAAPRLMQVLTVVGTAAMFLVGGGILVHGLPALHHAVQAFSAQWGGLAATVLPTLADALVGVLAGALVLLVLEGAKRLRPGRPGA